MKTAKIEKYYILDKYKKKNCTVKKKLKVKKKAMYR